MLFRSNENDLYGGDTVKEAATIFDNVLANKGTEAQKNVVIVNAAFAIRTMRAEKSIDECIDLARQSLEGGKAQATFKKYVELNS